MWRHQVHSCVLANCDASHSSAHWFQMPLSGILYIMLLVQCIALLVTDLHRHSRSWLQLWNCNPISVLASNTSFTLSFPPRTAESGMVLMSIAGWPTRSCWIHQQQREDATKRTDQALKIRMRVLRGTRIGWMEDERGQSVSGAESRLWFMANYYYLSNRLRAECVSGSAKTFWLVNGGWYVQLRRYIWPYRFSQLAIMKGSSPFIGQPSNALVAFISDYSAAEDDSSFRPVNIAFGFWVE